MVFRNIRTPHQIYLIADFRIFISCFILAKYCDIQQDVLPPLTTVDSINPGHFTGHIAELSKQRYHNLAIENLVMNGGSNEIFQRNGN